MLAQSQSESPHLLLLRSYHTTSTTDNLSSLMMWNYLIVYRNKKQAAISIEAWIRSDRAATFRFGLGHTIRSTTAKLTWHTPSPQYIYVSPLFWPSDQRLCDIWAFRQWSTPLFNLTASVSVLRFCHKTVWKWLKLRGMEDSPLIQLLQYIWWMQHCMGWTPRDFCWAFKQESKLGRTWIS